MKQIDSSAMPRLPLRHASDLVNSLIQFPTSVAGHTITTFDTTDFLLRMGDCFRRVHNNAIAVRVLPKP